MNILISLFSGMFGLGILWIMGFGITSLLSNSSESHNRFWMIPILGSALIMSVGSSFSVAKVPMSPMASFSILAGGVLLAVLANLVHKIIKVNMSVLVIWSLLIVSFAMLGFIQNPKTFIPDATTHTLTPPTRSQLVERTDGELIGYSVLSAYFTNLLEWISPIPLMAHLPAVIWFAGLLAVFATLIRNVLNSSSASLEGTYVLGAVVTSACLTLSTSNLIYLLLIGVMLTVFSQINFIRAIMRFGCVLLLGILINPLLIGLAI